MSPHPRQGLAVAVVAGTPLLAGCFVALRIYARRRIGVRLGLDDYLIISAWVLSIALIYPSVRNIYIWHYGWHIWDVDPHDYGPDYHEYHKILLAFNILHTPILPLVKASIIFLLLKISSLVTIVRRTLIVILVFIIGACIGPWVALLFLCPAAPNGSVEPTVFNGLRCLSPYEGGILVVFLVTSNIFTDLVIFPLPIILMRGLQQISIWARLTVIASFSLSLGATVFGAMRLATTYRSQLFAQNVADWTYSIAYCLNHAENNAAIIVACLPPLRSLIIAWMSKGDARAVVGQTEFMNQRIHGDSFLFQTTQGDAKEVAPCVTGKERSESETALTERVGAVGKCRDN